LEMEHHSGDSRQRPGRIGVEARYRALILV
jgi:hypothetical protein